MNSALKTQTYIAKGNAPWFSNNWLDINKVISMNKLDSETTVVVCDGSVTDTTEMFSNCYELTTLDLSNFDTSNVKYMEDMFYNCTRLTTIKGVIDMKSCTDYSLMFENCPKLSGVKIKNPPSGFNGAGLYSSQYTIVS